MNLESKKEALVIDFFLTNKNNTSTEIAKVFDLSLWTINNILNKYFKTKKINE
jgi:DNA-binding CsgD family transcriptional regulator